MHYTSRRILYACEHIYICTEIYVVTLRTCMFVIKADDWFGSGSFRYSQISLYMSFLNNVSCKSFDSTTCKFILFYLILPCAIVEFLTNKLKLNHLLIIF